MDRDVICLLDVISSARMAQTYIEGISHPEFLQDTKLQDSVIRRLEIVGEAVSRISSQFKEKNPDIPWNQIETPKRPANSNAIN